ncbi:unnamed protein product [Prunus armeniaca]
MGVLINFWGRKGERKRKRSRRGHQKQYGSFTALCFSLPQPLLQVLHGGSTKVLQGTMCASSTTSLTNNSSTNVIPKTMILAFVVFRPKGSTNGDFGSSSRAAHFISAISGIWTTMVFLMCLEILFVCANNLTGEYSLLDPSTFDLPSLSSSIPVKQIGVNRPHPGGVGQRPSDA